MLHRIPPCGLRHTGFRALRPRPSCPAEADTTHLHPWVRCAVYDRAFPRSGKRSKTFQFAQCTAKTGGTTGSSEKLRFPYPRGGEETANTSGLDLGVEVRRSISGLLRDVAETIHEVRAIAQAKQRLLEWKGGRAAYY